MHQSGRPSLKDLALLVSLFLLAILLLGNVIVSFVLQIPFQDPTEGLQIYDDEAEYDEETFQFCFNNSGIDCNSTVPDCPCAVQFSPNQWGFLMHIFSYLLTAGAVAFLISNVFRTGRDGKAYNSPAVFSHVSSICANLTLLLYLPWLFLWDQGQWTASTIILLLTTLTSWASVVIFSINLSQESEYLNHDGPSPWDLWVYRILVQNALAVQGTWSLLLLLINFSLALVYDAKVEEPQASAVNIIILTFIVAIWTPFELMICDKIFRYMMSPFIVIMWTLASIFDRLTNDNCQDATISVYTLVLLIIVVVLLVGRILLTVYKHIRRPLEKNQ